MVGETEKSEAICLAIRPWSRTSHVVSWLTPRVKIATVVKGAVRPKSVFLGQYDLNYTREIVYYARAKGELHALREASPLAMRERLRGDYRALALADYYRRLVGELAPTGQECVNWYRLLTVSLDGMTASFVRDLLVFELGVLKLAGLSPDFSGYDRAADWTAFCSGAEKDASFRSVLKVSAVVSASSEYYEAICTNVAKLRSALGEETLEGSGKQMKTFSVTKDFDVYDEKTWPDAFSWYAENLMKMRNAIFGLIDVNEGWSRGTR